MPKISPKIIFATLLGIVFLLGGATTVSALDTTLYGSGSTISATAITSAGAPLATAAGLVVPVPIATTATKTSEEQFLLSSIWNGCNGIEGCLMAFPKGFIAIIAYFLYKLSSVLLSLAGSMFDYTIAFSISTAFVDQPFINTSWIIMRDFSNMLFIFILLYTGIQTMLGMGKDWRSVVIKVIIVALLINFSLFFTKIVIDAGNVLAVGVKSAISSDSDSLSKSLVAKFSPQSFTVGAAAKDGLDAAVILLVATVVSGFTAWVLFKIAMVFVGRLIAFWFMMIISPFAFISTTLPKGNIFGWWFDTLLKQSFVAPIFLFALYLIMQVANSGMLNALINKVPSSDLGFFSKTLFLPILIATVLVVALHKAKELTESLAGDFGALGSKLSSNVLGLATGGASLVGQKTLGRGAAALAGSDKFKSMAANSAFGRVAYNLTDKAANSTYDVRNTLGGSTLGLGKGTAGSYAETAKKTKEADVEFGKKVMYDKEGKLIPGAAEAYAAQLEKGYITRSVTGGNASAQQAAKETRKTVEKEGKKETQKAARIAELEAKQRDLQEKYGELLSDAQTDPEKYENAHNKASATLRAAEKAIDTAEEGGNKSAQRSAAKSYADALAKKKTTEKELNMYNTGKAELSKIHKDIEDLKA